MRLRNTDLPAYSDTFGTWEKCHCKQIVTVSKGSLLTNQSFGTRSKCQVGCHCKQCHCNWGHLYLFTNVTKSNKRCNFQCFRRICTWYLRRHHQEIGADRVIVQIDETLGGSYSSINLNVSLQYSLILHLKWSSL